MFLCRCSSSTIGVLFPPIEACSVEEYPSGLTGRPWPLKSIPAYGDRRRTGLAAIVMLALHTRVLPGEPAGPSGLNTARTVGAVLVCWRKHSPRDSGSSASLSPIKNILSRDCDTP